MEKKKVLKNIVKILVILVVILLVFFIIHTIKNYVIITDLQNKISKYQESTNYNIKSSSKSSNGIIVDMDYYRKNSNQVVFMERNINGEVVKLSMYDNGERVDTFTETKDLKSVRLNSGELMNVNIYNYLETDNKWQTLLACFITKISSTNYNEKACYVVKNYISATSLADIKTEIYIDKETGLLLKTIDTDTISEREYEFNKVEDSIFMEPDISQYELKENS